MIKLPVIRSFLAGALGLVAVAALSAQSPYHLVPHWGKLPAGMEWGEVPAAAVDAKDTVLVFRRSDPPIMEFDRSGTLLKSWGEGLFVWPHGIRVDRSGNIWVTDGRAQNGRGQQVFKFDRSGTLLLTLGTKGVSGEGPDTFNGPCDVAVAANGDIFVADGHGNGRIVKFAKDGTFIKAWGKRGSGPGEMNVPHSLALDSRGRVIVTDRGNHRLLVFDAEGTLVDQWAGFGTSPDGIFIAADDTMYVADVAEGGDGITIASAKDGKIREKIGGARPEGMAVDSHGTIYGGETTSGRDLKVFSR
jgi:DNA-binding beta-propeller fold protein YncE